jgi:hypothetical protein
MPDFHSEAHALAALLLEAFPERLVQPLHALARIALQAVQEARGDGFVALDITLPDLVDRKLFDTCHG